MKNFTSKTTPAWQVMRDDWIRIAGHLYRVEETTTSMVNPTTQVIRCKDESGDPQASYTLMIPRHTGLKIHNQK